MIMHPCMKTRVCCVQLDSFVGIPTTVANILDWGYLCATPIEIYIKDDTVFFKHKMFKKLVKNLALFGYCFDFGDLFATDDQLFDDYLDDASKFWVGYVGGVLKRRAL